MSLGTYPARLAGRSLLAFLCAQPDNVLPAQVRGGGSGLGMGVLGICALHRGLRGASAQSAGRVPPAAAVLLHGLAGPGEGLDQGNALYAMHEV